MHKILLGVISVLSLFSSATRVSKECISKLNVLAGNDSVDVSTSTVFDWSDEIVADFHKESVPVL